MCFSRHTLVSEEEVGNHEFPLRRLIYKHKIELGATKVNHYGLALASKTNLPEDTVKLAMELSELIVKDRLVSEVKQLRKKESEVYYIEIVGKSRLICFIYKSYKNNFSAPRNTNTRTK